MPAPADPTADRRWTDLRKRALSAALLLPAAVLGIWLGAEAWAALMAAGVALLAWEWVRLCGFSTRRLPGMAVPIAVLAAGTLAVADHWLWALGLLAIVSAAMMASAARAPRRPDLSGRWLGFGVAYVGVAGVALIHLRGDAAAGLGNVLFLFCVVWASDIGAYLAGRLVGGPKLAPAISPGKTWSGAAGGLLSSVLVGLIAALALQGGGGVRVGQAVLVAAALGVVSQIGDLFESWIKRRFRVKDSSALIPGHGGLLDRLDGVIAAAPVAALLGLALGAGQALWR